tara:strand:- start:89 stop:421 length:333 start_codon:yes stop_codon:yes gene_type:complete
MRKIKKKNKKRIKKKGDGGAIFFTVGVAGLIGLVGIVHIAISNFINVYIEDEKRYSEEIAMFKEERDALKDKNNILFSSENIFDLLKNHEYFLMDSLSVSPAKDTIKVRF